jgi:hypothetical protein
MRNAKQIVRTLAQEANNHRQHILYAILYSTVVLLVGKWLLGWDTRVALPLMCIGWLMSLCVKLMVHNRAKYLALKDQREYVCSMASQIASEMLNDTIKQPRTVVIDNIALNMLLSGKPVTLDIPMFPEHPDAPGETVMHVHAVFDGGAK